MQVAIDSAGRVVIPKALREALDLKPGLPLEIRAVDGMLQLEVAATPMQLSKRGQGVVAVSAKKLPKLTAEEVRESLERVRR